MPSKRSKYYVPTVADLEDGVLRCKAYGHAWDQGPVNQLSPVGREVWVVNLRCTSCTKRRTDYVTPGTFDLEERNYSQVYGFSVVEPAKRADYRAEIIERQRRKQRGRNVKVPEDGAIAPPHATPTTRKRSAKVVAFQPPTPPAS